MPQSAVATVVAAVLLVAFAGVWAWMGYLTVCERWAERSTIDGDLPFSLRPRVTLRAWVGGACGLAAFLCVLFLLGKLRL